MGKLYRTLARDITRRLRAHLHPPLRSVIAALSASVAVMIAMSALALALDAKDGWANVHSFVGGWDNYHSFVGGWADSHSHDDAWVGGWTDGQAYGWADGNSQGGGWVGGWADGYDLRDADSALNGSTEVEGDFAMTANAKVVEINHSRSINDIVRMAKINKHTGFTPIADAPETQFKKQPSFRYPYDAGVVSDLAIHDAQNLLRMVRYVAGLPYKDVTLTAELNRVSQHGAMFMAMTSFFGHDISEYLGKQGKPMGLSESFLSLAREGCAMSNISAGINNISVGIMAFVTDGLPRNMERAGHRRWILRPDGAEFGIGYAHNESSKDDYRGYRIVMHVQDGKPLPSSVPDSFVAWPSAGYFPIEYFYGSEDTSTAPTFPWTVNLGEGYMAPKRDKLRIAIMRKRQGAQDTFWLIDKRSPLLRISNYDDVSQHLAVDDGSYGMGKAIVFRPDVARLGNIIDGDVFEITIAGLEDSSGAATAIGYEIRFFSLGARLLPQKQAR